MIEAYLLIDESGAKGYSSTKASSENEIGVMAGYLVFKDDLNDIKNEMSHIADSYHVDSKLHITDLSTEQQQSLRKEYFDVFLKKQLLWFYVAHYADGFYHGESKLINNSKPTYRLINCIKILNVS